MRISRRSALMAMGAIGLMPASGAMAGVSLALSANPSTHTGNSATVDRSLGQSSFAVGVNLISTSTAASDTHIDGISYRFQQLTGPQVGGVFTLAARDLTSNIPAANQFIDPTKSDSIVLAAASASFNPSTSDDLGSSTNNDPTVGLAGNNYPGGTGTTFNPNLLATDTISVAPGAPNGTYTIGLLYYGANSDYAYYLPNDPNSVFIYQNGFTTTPTNPSNIAQTFTVVVVPEPSSAVLLGLGTAALTFRRRRRALSFGL